MIEEKLKKLGIVLPKPPKPVGSYAAYEITGNLVFISGQVSLKSDGTFIKGKAGKDLTFDQSKEAAEVCCLNMIAQLKNACGGDLNKVKKCIKITGYVNSTDDFTEQPQVINGASDLLFKIFGDKGIHARAAVSANSLPLGVAVEIESIFEIN